MILLLVAAASGQDGFAPAAGMYQGTDGLELLDPAIGDQGSGYVGTMLSATELIDDGARRISAARLSTGYTLAPALRLDVTLPWLAAVVNNDVLITEKRPAVARQIQRACRTLRAAVQDRGRGH